ncbi:hypothetical protein [Aeromicrobium sp. UC242_57]|uniref:hypothetical protein n=1 Tax=Aeromicrobium sp. UC242_57 TaxID=3374624 RepID=UPI00379A74D0
MRVRPIEGLRALPPLAAASALMYGAGVVLILLGLITWQPERNPIWILLVLAAAATGTFVWTLLRRERFTMNEAFMFMGLQPSRLRP